VRLFIALPAATPVRDEAAAVLERLQATRADFKWVDPGRLHWTLHFFGETDEGRLPHIVQVLGEAAAVRRRFQISLGRAGAFPNPASPRVVWLGLERGEAEMAELASDLRSRLAKGGWPIEDRSFQAHLTLGRRRSPRGLGSLTPLLGDLRASASMTASEIVLFRSRLSSEGPSYEALQSSPLAP